jgi:hypothetical protein
MYQYTDPPLASIARLLAVSISLEFHVRSDANTSVGRARCSSTCKLVREPHIVLYLTPSGPAGDGG